MNTTEIRDLLARVATLLDNHEYEEARDLIIDALSEIPPDDSIDAPPTLTSGTRSWNNQIGDHHDQA